MNTFTIVPSTTFELRESAEFGFGGRDGDRFDGVMRLAFVLDGYREQVGVEVRQDATGGAHGPLHGPVHGTVHGVTGEAAVAAARRQVARVLSLDADGRGFLDVGRRDPVIGELQRAAPGLLPPLFYSPYEAAVWSVMSARRAARQMADVRARMSARHGRVFELAGRSQAALPTPSQLLRIREFPGLSADKIARMHGIATAAQRGILDAERLRALGPDIALQEAQHLKGIGPFYASLITIRAVGFTDVLPRDEPIIRELVTRLYRLPSLCTPERFEEIAEPWRPYRTWASVLVRAAAGRRSSPAQLAS